MVNRWLILGLCAWMITACGGATAPSTTSDTGTTPDNQALATATTVPTAAQTDTPVATLAPSMTPEPTATLEPSPTTAPIVQTDGQNVDFTPRQPIAGGPTLLDSRLAVRRVATVPTNSIRMVYDASQSRLLILTMGDGLIAMDVTSGTQQVVATAQDMLAGAFPTGLAVATDGRVFVVGNQAVDKQNQGVIRRGTPSGTGYAWTTLAQSELYPLSGTPFDHQFNGIVVSPDQQYVLVNSGSRTDHGEVESFENAFPDTREVPLTAKIYRLPIDGTGIVLPNTAEALAPYVFASGFRNAYDPAFAPNGELFVGDNGPDADYPDEFNWVRAGLHYGFPWRFGTNDNPQRNPDYDPSADKLLQPDFTAVQSVAYANDPNYPAAPATMQDPIANAGPAAVYYRGSDGAAYNAAQRGETLASFTPHRSPLGLTFADASFPADWQGRDGALSAFILSWGAAGGTLPDRGQDLLHLELQPSGDNYRMTARQIVRDLRNPIDAATVENRMYVLEFGADVAVWEFVFE